ncbi:pectinesterase family protein [Formosa sp. A9]|uniref:pectinesterase family protein n=1 Tax=Formosa sp. A9 TaxID=3442641 RepID=UPI003EBF8519
MKLIKNVVKHYLVVLGMLCFFIVGNAQNPDHHFTVAKDGSAHFASVQQAIMAVPDFRKSETVIFIKNGVYKEKLILPTSKTNVTFIGENVNDVVITYDDYASKKNSFGEEKGTTGSTSFYVFADNFKAKNITFENSSGPVGQAVAVRVDGDLVSFENCKFLGFQDTLYVHGKDSRQHYKDCYIEGTTDFIFGWSVAVFENCEIYSKKGGSYITAASTNQGASSGLTFINCKLTGDAPENSVYLGRPWRNYAQTVFINCEMGKHIKAEGWHNWGKKEAEKTVFYAEYNSKGPGASKQRVNWSHQLTEEEVIPYQVNKILAD